MLFSFQNRSSELDKQKELVDELRSKITSLEEGKGWLERRLAETEVRLINEWAALFLSDSSELSETKKSRRLFLKNAV